MKKLMCILSLWISFSIVQATEQDSLFLSAQKQYKSGAYEKAYLIFDGLIKEGYQTANLYYNFANTCFEVGEIAQSIAYYEKALKLHPNDEDIQSNLIYVKSSLGIDEGLSKSLWPQWVVQSIYVIFFVFFWSTLLLSGIYFINKKNERVRKYKWVLFVLTGMTALLAIQSVQTYLTQKKVFAIVQDDIHLYRYPSSFALEVYEIFTGQKIEVLQSEGGWSKIKADGEKTGWIPAHYMIEI